MNTLTIFTKISDDSSFRLETYDIWREYNLTFTKTTDARRWMSGCDLSLYQNQLNFATWCASKGCLVELPKGDSNQKQNFLDSIMHFHLIYQTRKILHEMGCPVPGEKVFDKRKNPYSIENYRRLCNEFDLSLDRDWRYREGDNHGLGTMIIPGRGPMPGNRYSDPTPSLKYMLADDFPAKNINAVTMSNGGILGKVEKIIQNDEGWRSFLYKSPENPEKRSKSGVTRLNDSIRTYVFCILGAQAETRAPIVGSSGNSFDSQAQFQSLLNDAIVESKKMSRVQSIDRYQKAINDTHKRLDFIVGPMLYLVPNNLVLELGVTDRWNNAIQVADLDAKSGMLTRVNEKRILPSVNRSIQDKPHTTQLVKKVPKVHMEQEQELQEKLVRVHQQNISLEAKPKVESPKAPSIDSNMYRLVVSLAIGLLASFIL